MDKDDMFQSVGTCRFYYKMNHDESYEKTYENEIKHERSGLKEFPFSVGVFMENFHRISYNIKEYTG